MKLLSQYARQGLTYTHLTTPDTHDSFKTLRSTNIPSKIIIQFGWIRESRKRVIVVNLQTKDRYFFSRYRIDIRSNNTNK